MTFCPASQRWTINRMRLSLSLLTALIFAISVSAQKPDAETGFEKNKAKYTREHFAEGEDASSGYDYLFYKDGEKIVMIRSIWSASWSKELRIEDWYFDGGLVLMKKAAAPSRRLSFLKRGRNVTLTQKEEMHFKDGKLLKWLIGGKSAPLNDEEWGERQTNTIEGSKLLYENYKTLKKGYRPE